MKLTTMTQVTVVGVMQGNGGASDEDRKSGFERGGRATGVAGDETRAYSDETYQGAVPGRCFDAVSVASASAGTHVPGTSLAPVATGESGSCDVPGTG